MPLLTGVFCFIMQRPLESGCALACGLIRTWCHRGSGGRGRLDPVSSGLFDPPQLPGRRASGQSVFDSLHGQVLELGGVCLPRYLHRPPVHGDGEETSPVEDEISGEPHIDSHTLANKTECTQKEDYPPGVAC